jgi:putative membrane protein
MKRVMCVCAVVLAMAASPALAKGKAKAAGKSMSDQTFVTKAAKGGMAEVELGKLAADKGSSDQVKTFGKRMADDHGKANDELKSLAQSKNITLPTDLDPKDKALRDRLSKLSGDAFDRAYMQAMVSDHRKDVNEFRMESRSGKDAEVKAWAGKTLPTLEDHLKMAQDANKAVGTSGSMSTKTTKTPKK